MTRKFLTFGLAAALVIGSILLWTNWESTPTEIQDSQPSAEGIVKNYIDALGGQKKIDKIETFSVTGIIKPSEANPMSPKVTFARKFKKDMFISNANSSWSSGKKEDTISGYRNDKAWLLSGKRKLVDANSDDQVLRTLEISGHPKSAVMLASYPGKIELLDMKDLEHESDLVCVKFTSEGDKQTKRFFDRSSGLLVKSQWVQTGGSQDSLD